MKISSKLAKKIVDNLENIIQQDLNFIDKDGYIIASTDESRVNTFHQASLKCLKQNKTIAVYEDDVYIGTKKGINLPVQFEGKAIGVIGISGDISEVGKFGEIIKKMTEILILENWIEENIAKKRLNDRINLESIVNNTFQHNMYLAESFNDYKKYIISSSNLSQIRENISPESILAILDSKLDSNDLIYSVLYNRIIILAQNVDEDYVERIINSIYKELNALSKTDIRFGISSSFTDLVTANKYLKQAENVVEWIDSYRKELVFEYFYNMDLGILVSDLNKSKVLPFTDKVIGNLNEKDFEFYNKLINVFADHNGSINNISKELFMHKNSVQYRLDRLHELTGYNPRNLDDYVILRLAFLLASKD